MGMRSNTAFRIGGRLAVVYPDTKKGCRLAWVFGTSMAKRGPSDNVKEFGLMAGMQGACSRAIGILPRREERRVPWRWR